MSGKPKVFTGTVVDLRARLDERALYAKRIMKAMLAGDHDGCAEAQRQMREAFPDAWMTQ
jgi:hypothetical protein